MGVYDGSGAGVSSSSSSASTSGDSSADSSQVSGGDASGGDSSQVSGGDASAAAPDSSAASPDASAASPDASAAAPDTSAAGPAVSAALQSLLQQSQHRRPWQQQAFLLVCCNFFSAAECVQAPCFTAKSAPIVKSACFYSASLRYLHVKHLLRAAGHAE